MNQSGHQAADAATEAEWEVWYVDTFDRECPPSVDVHGRGLVAGLIELWARFLFETVQPGGGRGFSRFHLRWEGKHVGIEGDWEGTTRMREWVFGMKKRSQKGYVEEGDVDLLRKIATAHANLLIAKQTGTLILAAAASARNRQDFEARLLGLQEHRD